MQTALRMAVIIFAASLLGASLTSAASHVAQSPTKSLTKVTQARTRPIGMASWYGERHQGRKMANGQKFNLHELTPASWTLPLGTMIRVVNLENGKSVVVTISDRGPNQRLHRILDLSKAAAEELNYVDRGLTPGVFFSCDLL
jgi:rare lipoprotein A